MQYPTTLTLLALAVLALASSAAAATNPIGNILSSLLTLIKYYFPDMPLSLTLLTNTFTVPLTALIARNSYVTRSGGSLQLMGKPWTASGANVYWLGLDENVVPPPGAPYYAPYQASYPTKGRITEVMNVLSSMGARTIRSQTMGVSVGNPLSLMPELGKWNEQAFESMDWTVWEARRHGLRIFAPLTDNYDYYHGGKFNFLRFRGVNITGSGPLDSRVMLFYTDPTIISDFKTYIKKLLTHKNPYTGLTYAEDPTIFAYETGNELGGPKFGDLNVPVAWTKDIADYIKSLAPKKLVVDGTYGVNKTHLGIDSIDIFSNHYYPSSATKLQADLDLLTPVNKPYLAAEYDWKNPGLSEMFALIEARQALPNPIVVGDHFWSMFEHNVPDCGAFVEHGDGFTLQYGNPANSAAINGQISKIRQHLWKMRGVTVGPELPQVACPGPEDEFTGY